MDAADWAGRTPVHWAVLVDASGETVRALEKNLCAKDGVAGKGVV